MSLSAFRTLANVVNGAYGGAGDIITGDLDFSENTESNNNLGTPINVMREIQVQFSTDTAGVLFLTFNGTDFFEINDGNTITGTATFTIFVDNTTLLNFEFTAAASIILTVGG